MNCPNQTTSADMFVEYFFASMKYLGIRKVFDSLNGDANGALWNPQSLDPDTKTRSNSRTAYWNSASNRTNLHLLTGQQATKLITKLNNKGVEIIGVEVNVCQPHSSDNILTTKIVCSWLQFFKINRTCGEGGSSRSGCYSFTSAAPTFRNWKLFFT